MSALSRFGIQEQIENYSNQRTVGNNIKHRKLQMKRDNCKMKLNRYD